MSTSDLAARVEASILRPEATAAQVHKLVTDALHTGCFAVVVAPVWVARVVTMLRGSGLRVCAACSFPFGTAKSTIKAIECSSAVKDGADEIEVVAHLPYLLASDVDSARHELLEVARAARAARRDVVIKVVVETTVLPGEAALAAACRAVRESGGDVVVTSTGFHPAGGATADAVAMLRKHGEGLLVKAAGGIATAADAATMLAAGADRIGTDDPVYILHK